MEMERGCHEGLDLEVAMEDYLQVVFDRSENDEPGLCVTRKDADGNFHIVKMELGEQAEMLYRLLTNQDVKIGLPK